MNKWNLVIDVALCHDCNNCFLSCKDEFFENDFPPYSVAQPRHGHRWIDIQRKERGQYPKVDVGYLPIPCMHCDEADCIKAATNGAVFKREDGIVLIDPQKAKGQKAIVDSCPYGVIYWNEDLDLPQKCTFCANLLDDGWTKPRCVHSCPTGAMEVRYVEDAEMKRMAAAENLEVYHPEFGLSPRVYYKNLYRFTRCFIAGNVVLKDKDSCAEGAKVSLKDSTGKVVQTTTCDSFGDFRLDDLGENSGKYKLEVEHPGYARQEATIILKESVNLGAVFL